MDILTAILPPVSALLGVGLGAWLHYRLETKRERDRQRAEWLDRVSNAVRAGIDYLSKADRRAAPERREAVLALLTLSTSHPDPKVARAAFTAAQKVVNYGSQAKGHDPPDFSEVYTYLGRLVALARGDAYGSGANDQLWSQFLEHEREEAAASQDATIHLRD